MPLANGDTSAVVTSTSARKLTLKLNRQKVVGIDNTLPFLATHAIGHLLCKALDAFLYLAQHDIS
jgi:hypothetical protein